MVYGIVYLITCLVNGKKYVGQTTRSLKKRLREHRNGNQYIDRTIRKYGWENFTVEVLEECNSKQELDERERFWIIELDCKVPNGYNVADGGEGSAGWHQTPEACARIVAANSGENHYRYGKPLSDEEKAILSEKMSGEKNPFFGRHHTDKTKKTIAEKLTGRHLSEEHKAKISAKGKGKSKSEKTRAEMSASCKTKRAVICVELGIIYESLSAAARCHGIHYAAILRACKNPQATSCGFHWRFVGN